MCTTVLPRGAVGSAVHNEAYSERYVLRGLATAIALRRVKQGW